VTADNETQGRRQALNDWFDHKFLAIYQNKENVEKGRRVLHRYQPTDEILEQIVQWVIADNRARYLFRKNNRFYREPCNIYTFFSDSRWHDEIPSLSDPEKSNSKLVCSDCGQAEYLARFQDKLYCCKCYDKHAHPDEKQKVYDNLKRIGLGKMATESRDEWLSRVRDAFVRLAREYEKRVVGNHSTQRPSSSLNPEIRNAQGRVGTGEV